MEYSFCGNSGLQLPKISLGLWHNFGDVDDFAEAKKMVHHAFDNGITHFDLANNYGPPPGSAEQNFGKILSEGLKNHRDELIISSKAGHLMWSGPYGDGSSRKSIMASINQSLKRTGLEYFDIFYSHRYDHQTPVEETMQALIDIVKQGKALYVGLSKYPLEETKKAYKMLREQHVPCLVYQDKYSMFHRYPEEGHLELNEESGVGFVSFSPLAQGLLTDRYLNGIADNSRAAKSSGFLQKNEVTFEIINKAQKLNQIAQKRGQTLAEMALAWVLSHKEVTSAIVGVSSVNQLDTNLGVLKNMSFSKAEISEIEKII